MESLLEVKCVFLFLHKPNRQELSSFLLGSYMSLGKSGEIFKSERLDNFAVMELTKKFLKCKKQTIIKKWKEKNDSGQRNLEKLRLHNHPVG